MSLLSTQSAPQHGILAPQIALKKDLLRIHKSKNKLLRRRQKGTPELLQSSPACAQICILGLCQSALYKARWLTRDLQCESSFSDEAVIDSQHRRSD
ncbi:UNVERIFIED_CONTAM: hypothetical protein FKN15_037371 [Acipenser sinensis]